MRYAQKMVCLLVLVLAEGLFLYYSYNDLYGGVERAVENRFSTVVGRLQATGTAGDVAVTAESRGQVLRRVVEQFDEKDKFEFMLLDNQGVILATSSGTMNRDLTNGTDYGRVLAAFELGEHEPDFETRLNELGYECHDETHNPAFRFFLAG